MIHLDSCTSPLGHITLAADENALLGLWFDGQKHYLRGLPEERQEGENKITSEAKRWLKAYFNGENPPVTLPLNPNGSCFAQSVYTALLEIPYGKTMTYGELAVRVMGTEQGRRYARSVGTAVGRNPISIMIPCHRILGVNRSLTGYAGGIERKRALLELECTLYSMLLR